MTKKCPKKGEKGYTPCGRAVCTALQFVRDHGGKQLFWSLPMVAAATFSQWGMNLAPELQNQIAGGFAARAVTGSSIPGLSDGGVGMPQGPGAWSWSTPIDYFNHATSGPVDSTNTDSSVSGGLNITYVGNNTITVRPFAVYPSATDVAIGYGVTSAKAYIGHDGWSVTADTAEVVHPDGSVSELTGFVFSQDPVIYGWDATVLGDCRIVMTVADPYNTTVNISAASTVKVIQPPQSIEMVLNVSALPLDGYGSVVMSPDWRQVALPSTGVRNVSWALQYPDSNGAYTYANGMAINGVPTFYFPIDNFGDFNVSQLQPVLSIGGQQVPVSLGSVSYASIIGLGTLQAPFVLDPTWRMPFALATASVGGEALAWVVEQIAYKIAASGSTSDRLGRLAATLAMLATLIAWVGQMAGDTASNPEIPDNLIGLRYTLASSFSHVEAETGKDYAPGFSGYVAAEDLASLLAAGFGVIGQMRSTGKREEMRRVMYRALTWSVVAIHVANTFASDPSIGGVAGASINAMFALVAQVFIGINRAQRAAVGADHEFAVSRSRRCFDRCLFGDANLKGAGLREALRSRRDSDDRETSDSRDGDNLGAGSEQREVIPAAVQVVSTDPDSEDGKKLGATSMPGPGGSGGGGKHG